MHIIHHYSVIIIVDIILGERPLYFHKEMVTLMFTQNL